MTTRPTINLPGWDASGNRLEPDAGLRSSGYIAGGVPTAEVWNWINASVSEWVSYFSQALPGDRVEMDGTGSGTVRSVGAESGLWLTENVTQDGDSLSSTAAGASVAYLDVRAMMSLINGATQVATLDLITIRFAAGTTNTGTITLEKLSNASPLGTGWTTVSTGSFGGTVSSNSLDSLSVDELMDTAYRFRFKAEWNNADDFDIMLVTFAFTSTAIIPG